MQKLPPRFKRQNADCAGPGRVQNEFTQAHRPEISVKRQNVADEFYEQQMQSMHDPSEAECRTGRVFPEAECSGDMHVCRGYLR